MTRVRTRFFGPGKDAPQWTMPTDDWRRNMVRLMQIELTSQPQTTRFYIEGEKIAKTYIEVQRTGPFAGMALWQRDSAPGQPLAPRAISVLMSAADPEADRKALTGLHRLRSRLNYPDSVYLAIEADPRPMMATLYFDREAYEESALRASCDCLAEAFFEKLPPSATA